MGRIVAQSEWRSKRLYAECEMIRKEAVLASLTDESSM